MYLQQRKKYVIFHLWYIIAHDSQIQVTVKSPSTIFTETLEVCVASMGVTANFTLARPN